MNQTHIRVGDASFSVTEAHQWLSGDDADGAIVTFTGKVRNHNSGDSVATLTLEHYPSMTEKVLESIAAEARRRWELQRIVIIHRVGSLAAGEQIVFVGVSSAHRNSAFAGAEYIMDILKTRAPFWKRETTPLGDRWLDAKESDQQAAKRWLASN
ncbi:molybdopterin synthase catalytic subunit MoaE [Tatumella sp. UBA2305]|uniref:molybdopterin synthase catalytic subunit MoaE n=1 Tax=Tatumella sp. UBA2305 TaxID=1947647 RepID=UPI0025EB74B2|nr:molybdopterin synthase catalytic subunit MoaE [Tatumella sp. UBA2305]